MPRALSKKLSPREDGGAVMDYVRLLKPRVMSLVVFSGFVGMMVAPGHIHPLLGFITIICIAMSAGGAASVNMWFDRDIDAVMHRTRGRPVPMGLVNADTALEFGGFLIFAASVLMWMAINALAAFLLLFAAGFYVFIYTMFLKRRTAQNIVIGGAAGAIPPMIGWVAVTGRIDLPAIVMFLIIFLWTPPHFWALALYRNDDYRRARVPMMPLTAGILRTKIMMLVYTILLVVASFAPAMILLTRWLYFFVALVLGVLFILNAIWVVFDKTDRAAKWMFAYSIFYLFMLLTVLLIDHLWLGGT